MRWFCRAALIALSLTVVLLTSMNSPAVAAVRIEGQVRAGADALANSNVTLWAASAGEPRQLAQTKSGIDGQFQLGSDETPAADVILYLIAKGGEAQVNKGSGDNPAIALLAVLGPTPPARVVVNEMTTIASDRLHRRMQLQHVVALARLSTGTVVLPHIGAVATVLAELDVVNVPPGA